jgi:hypothetical protein
MNRYEKTIEKETCCRNQFSTSCQSRDAHSQTGRGGFRGVRQSRYHLEVLVQQGQRHIRGRQTGHVGLGDFHIPKYIGHHGWVGVWLDSPAPDWREIKKLIEDAYRLTASKRLVKILQTTTNKEKS